MKIETLDQIIGHHRLFAGLDPGFLALVVGCAKNVRFETGDYLLREGGSADTIYLIRHGRVGLELNIPGTEPMRFQTVGPDEVLGLSWLVPPYRVNYDARAIEPTRAIAIEASCLRAKCDADPGLGYAVMKRFAPVIVERLHATRLQMLDLFGNRG